MDLETEWSNFMSSKTTNNTEEDDDDTYNHYDNNDDSDGDCISDNDNCVVSSVVKNNIISANLKGELNPQEIPKSTNIYISTKTKISYLDTPIDLKQMFWGIPVMPYYKPCNGVVKKQMKFNSFTIEELEIIKKNITDLECVDEHIITSINNPNGRIKFKDIRKVSIGISKKDLLSYRCKKKSAFYNCFVLILRLKVDEIFKEFHVKVFNTGKVEIPGIQSDVSYQMILTLLVDTLQPHTDTQLQFKNNVGETVLINSNFNCGFYINRETLNHILQNKYNIHCIYDPCSYPGIQCKFYYNEDVQLQTGCMISEENKSLYKNVKEVSFMIFRTGSVLIVGKCDENVLIIIYEFLKQILHNEFHEIVQQHTESGEANKDKKKKLRKKNINVDI